MDSIRLILFVISLAVGVIVFLAALIFGGGKLVRTRAGKMLAESESRPAEKDEKDEKDLPPNLQDLHGTAKSLAEAGIHLSVFQYYLIMVGASAGLTVLGWIFFIPGLPSIALGGMTAFAIHSYVKERADYRGRAIDAELPLTMARISVGLQIGTSLQVIFDDAAKHLPANSQLAVELFHTEQEMLTLGDANALGKLADRSPSISLSNAAMMLQSYSRAGGPQYTEAVAEAAADIQKMIEVRNTARARAAQATQTAAIVPLMLAFVLVTLAADPSVGQSFSVPIVQVAIVFSMLMMGAGYLIIRSQVRKVV